MKGLELELCIQEGPKMQASARATLGKSNMAVVQVSHRLDDSSFKPLHVGAHCQYFSSIVARPS